MSIDVTIICNAKFYIASSCFAVAFMESPKLVLFTKFNKIDLDSLRYVA